MQGPGGESDALTEAVGRARAQSTCLLVGAASRAVADTQPTRVARQVATAPSHPAPTCLRCPPPCPASTCRGGPPLLADTQSSRFRLRGGDITPTAARRRRPVPLGEWGGTNRPSRVGQGPLGAEPRLGRTTSRNASALLLLSAFA